MSKRWKPEARLITSTTPGPSVEFGMALFYGKWQSTRMALKPVQLGDQVGSGAYREFSERGLALVRDRDEVFVRIRKTF